MEINPVAHIYTDFPTKFGIPRQSGLVEELKGRIVFEPYYRNTEAVKCLEEFNYIWLLWDFSMAHRKDWSATVKPPRLGGKTHIGVWATRSPHRPNSIGLSSVKLDRIEMTEEGPVLYVSGIDMADGTPVYDIKPYIPYCDVHSDAAGGFTEKEWTRLEVVIPDELLPLVPEGRLQALIKTLEEDPRPRYDAESDGKRKYGFYFCEKDVRFTVTGNVLTVVEIVPKDS